MGTYSSDDYETGTRAALHGGTTMVIDFILQTQGDTLTQCTKDLAREISRKSDWRLFISYGSN